MQDQRPKRIVIFCLPGIGDAILFTPALALLRQAFPEAHITVITMFRGTADILETNPDVNEVRYFDFYRAKKSEGLRYVLSLRSEEFDLSVMPFPSNRLEYNVVNWLVGRRWRAAHRYTHQSRRNLWFLNNIVVKEAGTLHNVEENLRLIRAICERFDLTSGRETGAAAGVKLKLALTADDERYAEEFLSKHGIGAETTLFGFHTYSSTFKNMHRKCWDKNNFIALIGRLQQWHPDARHLIFSGPADEEVNQYISAHLDGRVLVIRESNLRHVAAVLRRCRVMISNDSGLLHLAAAIGVPLVGLYGPTDWRRLHPWTDRHVIVRRDLPCMPCFYYSSRPLSCVANIDYACMRDISVDEVFDTIQNLLRLNP
jgi:heptosyltransferase-2